ncbi:MAG TPA: leucine-rich repeat domain-containing protein [Verrucomicrobiota bacterium]|nr:leucine-rich repeat domain-containing protein [Verrucomicrobiota bacterium]HQL77489.1 leucine-rich repeat domain-containing protein [Verrucomicrobiota bacterium]
MKTTTHTVVTTLAVLLFFCLPPAVQAQVCFSYETNNGTITITRGCACDGAVTIPDTINGLPVTSIANWAFFFCGNLNLTSLTIPNSVTSIGAMAFASCDTLTNVSIGSGVTNIGTEAFAECSSLTSVTIPDSVTEIVGAVFRRCYSLTNVTFGNHLTRIGPEAFNGCTSLSSVTFPDSLTNLADGAFDNCTGLTRVTIPSRVTYMAAFSFCTSLTGIYCKGNAPSFDDPRSFEGTYATVYYLPGTTGWGTNYGWLVTAPWLLPYPVILDFGPGFGVQSNQFGFIISWATNASVVAEACANLANPLWSPVGTNTLTGGWCYFSDPQWVSYPARFYRLRSP